MLPFDPDPVSGRSMWELLNNSLAEHYLDCLAPGGSNSPLTCAIDGNDAFHYATWVPMAHTNHRDRALSRPFSYPIAPVYQDARFAGGQSMGEDMGENVGENVGAPR